MNRPLPSRCRQQGVMLLEALISILIFSIGILAIIGLQAASIKMSSDAKYRSDASLLAGQYVNNLWAQLAVNPAVPVTTTPFDQNLFSDFVTDGAQFNPWLATLRQTLPDANANVTINTEVTCDYVAACSGTSTQSEIRALVDITITWKLPGSDSQTHTYATSTQITSQKSL